VNLELGVPSHEHPGRAGVIEVDVTEQQVPDVGERKPSTGEPFFQPLDARRWAAVEDRRPLVGLDEVRADDVVRAAVP
jgi:hypothetical protein